MRLVGHTVEDFFGMLLRGFGSVYAKDERFSTREEDGIWRKGDDVRGLGWKEGRGDELGLEMLALWPVAS